MILWQSYVYVEIQNIVRMQKVNIIVVKFEHFIYLIEVIFLCHIQMTYLPFFKWMGDFKFPFLDGEADINICPPLQSTLLEKADISFQTICSALVTSTFKAKPN